MTTPDYSGLQGYLDAPLDGLGVRGVLGWPWFLGRYTTVAIIDGDWLDTHEDLVGLVTSGRIETLGGAPAAGWLDGERSHGTQTLGVLAARSNGKGVTGVVPAARYVFSRPYGTTPFGTTVVLESTAAAMLRAAPYLSPSDVVLVERQVSSMPAETDPWVQYLSKVYCWAGVNVVTAAGNSTMTDLDAVSDRAFTLPANDSGSVFVGAGGVPGAVHPRRAYGGLTYGSRINVQAWGELVATTDSKPDLGSTILSPTPPESSYTGSFSATSSATAMVAGVVALASEVARRLSGSPVLPSHLRAMIAGTGSPQTAVSPDGSKTWDSSNRHIGPLPNLRALIRKLRWELCTTWQAPQRLRPVVQKSADRLILQGVANGLDACEIALLLAARQPQAVRPKWFGANSLSASHCQKWFPHPGPNPATMPGYQGRAVRAVESRIAALMQTFGASSRLELAVLSDYWGFVQ